MLILDVVTFKLFFTEGQKFNHFNNLQATDDGVGAGDSGHNVASHVLYLIERLLLNRKARHSEISQRRYKMDD
jgi:hypothetical protein